MILQKCLILIKFKMTATQFDNAQQGYDSYEEYLKTHKIHL